jgi:CRP-like cAMP-binding protein
MSLFEWKFLPDSVACVLDEVAVKKSFKKGDFLFHMGEKPRGLFFIFKGLVGTFNTSQDGKEHLFRIFGNGQCLGHRTLMAGGQYNAAAKVLEASEIGIVDTQTTFELLRKNHDFSLTMMKKLALELGRAEQRLAAATDRQVAERVAEAMIYLKETYPDHKWTRNEIAYYCGSTGPTVIRTLSEFEKKGFIEQVGRDISIKDKEALRSFAHLDEASST